MKPVLAYPVSPISINDGNVFGANVGYYEEHFGQKGHPGIDFHTTPHGQPVYAAHDGEAISIKDDHGGEGIHLLNKDMRINTIYWHLIGDTDTAYPAPIPFDQGWHPVKRGELIGYANNTGAPYESSGPHLHFGLQLVDANGIVLNQNNGTQGCVDPQPYFDGSYAHADASALAAQDTTVLVDTISHIDPMSPSAPQQLSLAGKAWALIKAMLQLAN